MTLRKLTMLSGICLCSWLITNGSALAKGRGQDRGMTAEEAIDDAEQALDAGRIGDASDEAEKLQKTHGLGKDLQHRVDLIVARCNLMLGEYGKSETQFAKLHKLSPDDARLSEWYARALEGAGKTEPAFQLLSELAEKDALADGDSYWTLAQIERTKGKKEEALKHAETALKKPILMQSDELDKAIHKFIAELSSKQK